MNKDQELYTLKFLAGIEKETFDVYAMFAQDGDGPRYVKIGYSKRAGIRQQGVKNGCPIPIIEVIAFGCSTQAKAMAAESAIHGALSEQRTVGEWFRAERKDLVMTVFALAASNHGCSGIVPVNPKAEARREYKRKKLRREYARRQ